ncbi:MAG: hypothetical protein ACKPEO_17500, partial [Sphaerospermopsis kisseleviana]
MARVYCENEGAKLFWQISYLKSLSNVSIPLRGKGYEKHQSNWMIAAGWGLAFPSPCGEKVMKNLYTVFHPSFNQLRSVGFPSPCGEKVMKNINSCPT